MAARGVRRRRTALWAVLLVGLAFATVIQNWSDNQSSHYDLIRALDAGRTTIDAGPYHTKDKAFYRGHWYSARAPGLAIYSLPFYELIHAVDAPALARSSQALRGEDEMIYFVGLWGSVLPGLVMLLLVWRVAERFEPGYGGPTAVVLGLGTMVLPFSTLLFSHVFAATLGFAAFAIMMRERAGPPRPLLLAAAGVTDGLRDRLRVPVGVGGAGARALHALAARRTGDPAARDARRRLRARRPRGDRAAAPLQPRRVPLVDAPRVLRTSRSSTRGSSASPRPACACWRRCCSTRAGC